MLGTFEDSFGAILCLKINNSLHVVSATLILSKNSRILDAKSGQNLSRLDSAKLGQNLTKNRPDLT